MKLAFIAPESIPAVGGIGTYSTTLASELAKKNIEVHVFTPNRNRTKKDNEELAELKKLVNIHFVSEARGFFLFNLWFQAKILNVFKRIDAKTNFDLIHSANFAGVPDIFLKIAGKKKPSIVTAHSTIETQFKGIKDSNLSFNQLQNSEKGTVLFYPLIKASQSFYLQRTNALIAVSDFVKQSIDENYSGASKKMFVVKNGIDPKKFSLQDNPSFFSAELVGKKKILFVGRLLALKGIKTILDSAPIVLQKVPDCVFVFAGSGEKKTWEKIAALNGISKNCLFLGRVEYDSVPHLANDSDVIVLPSFADSFPLTLLEAMACSKPVVASRIGGIPEIITDKKDGLLFEAGNPKELAAKIIYLLEDEKLSKNLGKNARQKVLSEFTAEKMAQKTIAAYNSILG